MHVDAMSGQDGEKRLAALSSVWAAVFLTAMKLAVGLTTGSLGILSEAAHSALDLLAAGVTYFAVRFSSLPADQRHPYGHGKMENLSALVETVLLLLTCFFIVHEAVNRLFFHPRDVEVTWWSFAVMAVSMVVDLTRSRMLKRMAEKHRSQALEADALHFSTDVWSSAVVMVGLGCVGLAGFMPADSPWRGLLERSDAMAALGVSAIVVWVSFNLGRRAVDVLLDGGAEGLTGQVRRAVGQVPGVQGVSQVRTRLSGSSAFVDLTVDIAAKTSFEEAHIIGTRAEEAVRRMHPGADVVVHLEPARQAQSGLFETVRLLAVRRGLSVHGLQGHQTGAGLHLEMHVDVPESMTLAEAHTLVSALEDDLRREHRGPLSIASHIEPVGDSDLSQASVPQASKEVTAAIHTLLPKVSGVSDCHGVLVHRLGGQFSVSFHCRMDPGLSIAQAHERTAKLENLLRAEVKDLGRVVIHVEPKEASQPG